MTNGIKKYYIILTCILYADNSPKVFWYCIRRDNCQEFDDYLPNSIGHAVWYSPERTFHQTLTHLITPGFWQSSINELKSSQVKSSQCFTPCLSNYLMTHIVTEVKTVVYLYNILYAWINYYGNYTEYIVFRDGSYAIGIIVSKMHSNEAILFLL